MWDMEEGTVAGSMALLDMRVMGPECSFRAAVMAASVEGASADASSVGSAMMSVDVDALRIEIKVDNWRPLLAIVESILD